MLRFEFESEQVKLLIDICDAWLEGYNDTKSDVTVDKGFENPEELLSAVTSVQELFDSVHTIRNELKRVLDAQPTS